MLPPVNRLGSRLRRLGRGGTPGSLELNYLRLGGAEGEVEDDVPRGPEVLRLIHEKKGRVHDSRRRGGQSCQKVPSSYLREDRTLSIPPILVPVPLFQQGYPKS